MSNIVTAPASTGRERRSKTTVIITDQTKRASLSQKNPLFRILTVVEMKLTAPRIELAPARWREKIARSTDPPLCEIASDKGG